MASTSKRPDGWAPQPAAEGSESWKDAPSRETTHDDPDSDDVATADAHRAAENSPLEGAAWGDESTSGRDGSHVVGPAPTMPLSEEPTEPGRRTAEPAGKAIHRGGP